MKLAGLATLALFSTDAQAAAPSSPFVGAAHSLDEVVTNADFATVIQLAQNLQRNKALFDLAQSQASATGRQTGSNLNFLGKHLFSGSPVSPTNPARAALRLARLINLDTEPDKTSSPTNRSALPVLTTPRTTCIQCDSALHLREHPDEPVWLVRPAQGAEQCLVAIYVCSNRACRARHAPDHVEIAHQDRSVWLWDKEATAIKIGERTWTTTDGAAHLRHLLLQQAVTPGGFAQLWNRQYSDLAAEDDLSSSSSMRDLPDSDEDDLEEEEERSRPSVPGPSPSHKGKRGRDTPFRLRAAHVWRAIIISSCLRAAALNPKYGRFASPTRPSTLDLVELANSCLFDPVLPPHQCATCTRPRQVWLGGPATEAERRAGIRWAGTGASESHAFEEDVKLIGGPPVQMAVCDGITIGYFVRLCEVSNLRVAQADDVLSHLVQLCAAPGCPNSPEKHRRASRFCDDHYDLHELCGVVGCGRARSGVQSGGGLSEACDDPAHEERWLKFVRLRDENRDRGWRGRANEPRRRPENVAPSLRNDDLLSDGEDDDAPETDDDDDQASGSGGKKRFSHMWAMRKSSHLQLLVASCGTPLAWRSFTSGETVRTVFDFLTSVHQSYTSDDSNPIPFPSYVAYDRACQVLRHASTAAVTVAEGGQEELPPFLQTTRLIVDSFHRQCHSRDDLLCTTLCNPAPLDGSAPDLVIPLRAATAAAKQSKKGSRSRSRRTLQERETGRVFQRAFNTSAAEQLNSQLSRFAFVLAGMKAPNFTFLVHVLLRYRREEM